MIASIYFYRNTNRKWIDKNIFNVFKNNRNIIDYVWFRTCCFYGVTWIIDYIFPIDRLGFTICGCVYHTIGFILKSIQKSSSKSKRDDFKMKLIAY